MLQRQPQAILDLIDGWLSLGTPCHKIADALNAQEITTSPAAVGRYRKNVWLPKVTKQKDTLALLEMVDPADPSKSLGRVNIALGQLILKEHLELLALDEDVTPEDAIPLILKAMMAQDKAGKAVLADVMAAVKAHQLDEINKAKEGDLLAMKGGKLVRVEIVEPGKPREKAAGKKQASKDNKALPAKGKTASKGKSSDS
jgi:hypothetical protein